jgi:hypothetical protein
MSRGFYSNMPRSQASEMPADPRFPIAQHINWTRPTGTITAYSGLEPDNYNYCVLAKSPMECDFIKDHVFYRDQTTSNWWTAYYVPKKQWNQFIKWIEDQDCICRWYHTKPAALRHKKGLLYNRANTPEFSFDEVLFTQGYYAKLNDKLFSDNDKILLDRMGPVRAEVINYPAFQQV